MNTPLVSVIMPAFNAEKYIAAAIDSVLQQTFPDWELIVIDDGSTDNTETIIKECATTDSRIIYIYQHNGGQGKARNNGLKKAVGEYIAFLDADDLWMPEKLTTQIEIMSTDKADLTFSDAWLFEDKPLSEKKMNITAGYYQGEEAVHKFLFCNYIPILTVVAKKSAIDKVNCFSENKEIAEDYHLWIRLLIDGKSFLGIDYPLAHYRVHNTSSSAGEGKQLFLALNCLKEIAGDWPQYTQDINSSMYRLINEHLSTMNISKWKIANQLLITRNSLSKEKISISFWKPVYSVFGKNIFRILFKSKMKLKGGDSARKKNERVHGPIHCLC